MEQLVLEVNLSPTGRTVRRPPPAHHMIREIVRLPDRDVKPGNILLNSDLAKLERAIAQFFGPDFREVY